VLRLLILALSLAAAWSNLPCAFAQSELFFQGGSLYGKSDTTWAAEFGFLSRRSRHFGLGFAYYNEGHLPDNHRDGYTVQAWFLQPLDGGFEFQLGSGPYVNMNNTTVNGNRENQFRLGLLSSAALKWNFGTSPWYLRVQYNNAWVPRSFSSNAVLLGVGRDFRHQEDENDGKLGADLGFWGGYSRTTQVGQQQTAVGYEFETKFRIKRYEHLAWSVGLLSEGNTNLADRKGVPIRLWYDQPASDRLTLSFGAGPYPAYNGVGNRRFHMNGIVSIRATVRLISRYETGLMYTRVASFANRDQDLVMLGLLVHL
jgi:hypothetical protein